MAGTSREMSIVVTGPERFTFEYRVVNTADHPQRLAAWAITMMAPLGRAWLPFLAGEFDPGGFQAQRNIALWSYARTDDPRFVLSDAAIEVRASVIAEHGITGSFKVGTSLRRGWLAHWRRGGAPRQAGRPRRVAHLRRHGCLRRRSTRTPTSRSSRRSGPLTDLAPGEAAVHREDWEVHLVGEQEAERLVSSGDLDR